MQNNVVGKDHIGVSAGSVIRNVEGEYFLAKRNDNARDDQGKWEFPGGSVRFNETREDAAKRNMLKKYGIEIKVDSVLGVYDVIDKRNNDHWLSTTFICSIIEGEPMNLIPEKCDDIGWFDLEAINDMEMSRISLLNLEDLKNSL